MPCGKIVRIGIKMNVTSGTLELIVSLAYTTRTCTVHQHMFVHVVLFVVFVIRADPIRNPKRISFWG